MRTLLLIPSVVKKGIETAVDADSHPRMDYHALTDSLREAGNDFVDVVDYASVESEKSGIVRLVRKLAGRDAALAMLGFLKRKEFDSIFTNGENVGIPLAILLKLTTARPGHVTIGHRLSTGKKKVFFRILQVHRQMDTIFVYATTQLHHAVKVLGIPGSRLSLIPFHADERFYRPVFENTVDENQICSAGLEWRDYPTLIDSVGTMPDLKVKLAAASPWSKHNNETAGRTLPANVDARRYEYSALRDLYAGSSFVVVPLYENDFQAGVTTLLEAMAMGKAVVVTRTTGQTDVVINGRNGMEVLPGDCEGLRNAIQLLRTDRDLRERLGRDARQWVEQNATLSRWVENITTALRTSTTAISTGNSKLRESEELRDKAQP
jgi:glycosyltransferase involved in cell wall biosynthesis